MIASLAWKSLLNRRFTALLTVISIALSVALLVGMISLIATIAGTTSQALAQLLVDEHYRGRVMSLWTTVAMGAPAAGALDLGLFQRGIGLP